MISAATGLWGIVLVPGANREFAVPMDSALLITGAVLGGELRDASTRTSVKMTVLNDESEHAPTTIVLCNLIPGQIEQAILNITLRATDSCMFEAIGPNTVHLSGNFVDELSGMNILRSVLHNFLKGTPDPALNVSSRDMVQAKLVTTSAKATVVNAPKRRRVVLDDSDTTEHGRGPEASSPKKGKGKERAPSSAQSIEPVTWKRIKGGIPSSKPVEHGDKVYLRYIVKTLAGVKIHASATDGPPMSFTVGEGKVPQGFEDGVLGMLHEERRIITVSDSAATNDPRLSKFMNPPTGYLIGLLPLHLFRATPLTSI
ncbi:hypothetical protein C8Q74DRAFT_1373507 [Fomes fomentarius]|nr:hypothetical protein C8Q74DRAFT_1373507 [Fomes fomentarius]